MVSPLLAKAAPTGREIVNVTPERAGWTHVGFRAVRLAAGEARVSSAWWCSPARWTWK
jgi:5-deoxy-glucuronate isomerase